MENKEQQYLHCMQYLNVQEGGRCQKVLRYTANYSKNKKIMYKKNLVVCIFKCKLY